MTTDKAARGTFEVVRHHCEACVVLEAEVENDHGDGRRPRGVKYAVIQSE